jgi:hypothetical protein
MKLVSLVLLTMAEACAQTPAVAPYLPPGKMVDLGGYRVHLNCTGQGSPAVMIVGGFSFDWSLVQPEVAAFTRVCTYDLSGTAWSDPGPGRGCPAWVHEVYGLFAHTEAEEPYVLVGLSAEAVGCAPRRERASRRSCGHRDGGSRVSSRSGRRDSRAGASRKRGVRR